jgi:hypothetical protein
MPLQGMNFASALTRTDLEIRAEKVAHDDCDLIGMRFQRKVACIEQVNMAGRQVAFVSLSTCRQKGGVMAAPDGKEGRLVLSEIGLKFRVFVDVGAIVIDQIELARR